MFCYPMLTILSQSMDCDRYGNLHYYGKKVVDKTKQSEERVNKLSNCHFFAQILKRNLNDGNDDDKYTKLILLTCKKNLT